MPAGRLRLAPLAQDKLEFMKSLDEIKQIQQIDKSNMAKYIADLPQQIEKSLEKINKLTIPEDWVNFQNVCLCGMGGSAVANSLVANLPLSTRIIPMKVVRDYQIPAWVNEQTLVILTSHSGQTQETLAAFKASLKKKAKIFIVAEKGELEELGEQADALVFDYDTSAHPRASLGFQLGAVYGLLKKLKIVETKIEPAIKLLKKIESDFALETETEKNLAKKIAFCCLDRLPVIVGSGILQSVAWRWKTQVNENANSLAFTEFLPEAMHNAVQGLDFTKHIQESLVYLILENSFDNPGLKDQFNKFKKVLDVKKIRYEVVQPVGDDVWSQKLSALILGDWVSYYLALLNNVDPTPVETIETLKK